jgi:fructose-1,6-bisphosphatase I
MKLSEHLKGTDPGIKKIILTIAEQAKVIHEGFGSHYGTTNTKNVYGETQIEMDKWADEILIERLKKVDVVKALASEEREDVITVPGSKGRFGVTMDPLDGSSCIKTNLAVGTIIGIFGNGDVLSKGKNMDAACLVIYGPLTTLLYACKGCGVHEFVLNPESEFVLRNESMKIPDGKIYSPGGLSSEWTAPHKKFVKELETSGYKLRYSGSLAADFNQILHYGGVFMYPALKSKPQGKLRLLFEANPMTFLVKEAGGAGSDGTKSIHEVMPEKVSHRTPFYIGSKGAIKLAEKMLKK